LKRIGIDSNVVLSFLTDRDPGQRARATELFVAAAAGEHVLVVHQQVVAEAVYVLLNVYGVAANVVSSAMHDLLELPGVVTTDDLPWPELWQLWPRRLRNFGDACLAASAKADAFDRLATFDAKFARSARRQGVPTWW
jgi:predicted nucleic acid-binding protein